MKVLLIPVEGDVVIEEVSGDFPDSLAAFHRLVGGYLEHIDLGNNISAWINEEGRLEAMPVNPRASALVARECPLPLGAISGPMVVTGRAGPETVEAPANVLAWAETGVPGVRL